MPEQLHLFAPLLKIPENLDELMAQNNLLEQVIDESMSDVEKALDEIESYDDTTGSESLLQHAIAENIKLRMEVMIGLLTFEFVHLMRDKMGIQYHPYTLTPHKLLNTLR